MHSRIDGGIDRPVEVETLAHRAGRREQLVGDAWCRTSVRPTSASVPRDLAPRRVGIEAGLTREAEHALADDVHLDLRRPAGDGGRRRAARTRARGRRCITSRSSTCSRVYGPTSSVPSGAHEVDDELADVDRARDPDSSFSTDPSGPGTPFSRFACARRLPEPQHLGVDPELHQPVAVAPGRGRPASLPRRDRAARSGPNPGARPRCRSTPARS